MPDCVGSLMFAKFLAVATAKTQSTFKVLLAQVFHVA
jgi:hypothetical protein